MRTRSRWESTSLFHDFFTNYGEKYVAEPYRKDFLEFIDPDNIRRRLAKELIITCRYLRVHDGVEIYEKLRMAGVRRPEDREDHQVHAIGVGFTDIDQGDARVHGQKRGAEYRSGGGRGCQPGQDRLPLQYEP